MAPALLLVPAALASFILAFGTGVEFVRFTSLRPLLGGLPESGPGVLPCVRAGRATVPEVPQSSETLLPPAPSSVCGAPDCAVGGAYPGRRPPPPCSPPHPLPGPSSWARPAGSLLPPGPAKKKTPPTLQAPGWGG
ncbi:nurim isoform X3 [Tamandua tetradactyla]|uniref:nurim isoform X3 n=1 Tax=Tamandua tetradactyla TaxID=48850 RepID=UPI004053E60C